MERRFFFISLKSGFILKSKRGKNHLCIHHVTAPMWQCGSDWNIPTSIRWIAIKLFLLVQHEVYICGFSITMRWFSTNIHVGRFISILEYCLVLLFWVEPVWKCGKDTVKQTTEIWAWAQVCVGVLQQLRVVTKLSNYNWLWCKTFQRTEPPSTSEVISVETCCFRFGDVRNTFAQ